eukprot:SAG31_NODE_4740_length_2988_cov_1.861890_1_plen_208_part_00
MCATIVRTPGFYAAACQRDDFLEGTTGPGDVMYVPRGWWHMLLNLESYSVAVSHHFLSGRCPAALAHTLQLLRERPYQVSGVDRGLARDKAAAEAAAADNKMEATRLTAAELDAEDYNRRVAAGTALHDRLVKALQEHRPETLAAAEAELLSAADSARKRRGPSLKHLFEAAPPGANVPTDRPAKHPKIAPATSFTFNFGGSAPING